MFESGSKNEDDFGSPLNFEMLAINPAIHQTIDKDVFFEQKEEPYFLRVNKGSDKLQYEFDQKNSVNTDFSDSNNLKNSSKVLDQQLAFNILSPSAHIWRDNTPERQIIHDN